MMLAVSSWASIHISSFEKDMLKSFGHFYFYKRLFEREKERGHVHVSQRRGRETQADSLLSVEPCPGLHPTTHEIIT